MIKLILFTIVICLVVAYAGGRFAAWLHLGKRWRVLPAIGCGLLLAIAMYLVPNTPPYFGCVLLIPLPFAAGFGAGRTAFFQSFMAGQLLVTWIFTVLFFWGSCRLKTYDGNFHKMHPEKAPPPEA